MKQLILERPLNGDLSPIKDSDGTSSSLLISENKIQVKDIEVTGTPIGTSDDKLPLSGGTMSGTLNMDENDIDSVGGLDIISGNNGFRFDGGTDIQGYIVSDTLSGHSTNNIASTRSIKNYVDANGLIKTATTIDESTMNSLHSTGVTLIAAPGSRQIILPVFFTLLVTRDGSIAQSSSTADLFISWNGATTIGQELGYIRRFMYNESGSRTYHFRGDAYGSEAYQSADPSNQALQIKLDAAITAGSIDSMKVITSYYVYDNS